jgi:hypothetical protein
MFPIASITTTSSVSDVRFSSIPQTFTHLQVRCFLRTTNSSVEDTVYSYNYNNNTGSTGSAYHSIVGSGTSATSGGQTGQFSSVLGYCPAANANTNVYGSLILDILDYTNTNKNKTLRSLSGYDNNGSGTVSLYSNLPLTLPGTGAVTSLTIVCNGNIAANSRFEIYGISTSNATGA